ncbi:hypothetical protein L1987_37870 [Smallanthus sonchifolius]|uniref:Uncharacterized protein n=1 Tax=Smallanthus sonchifolius TaxID=185202 RepID=A0ACB9HIX5_9ASTR|nr:hypothetical protein L1987_37870 [Smallanthus sonchifolius]
MSSTGSLLSYEAFHGRSLVVQLIPAVGIIAFAAWGLVPLLRSVHGLFFCRKMMIIGTRIVGAQHFAKASIATDAFNPSVDYASHMDGDGHGRIHGYFELEMNPFDHKSQHVSKEVF